MGEERFDSAIQSLPESLRGSLGLLPKLVKATATEVRLRVDQPLGLVCAGRLLFPDRRGQASNHPMKTSLILSRKDLQDSFLSLSGWAVHTHQKELAQGYLSIKGGHRAGLGATAVLEKGQVVGLRDVTSINLRIAREIKGAAGDLIQRCFQEGPCGLLLFGAPASGKTTILRDLARSLSSGEAGHYYKVCVVDESGEIGGASGGVVGCDLGPCCDLLSGYPKIQGLQTAIRYLSPQILICDEVCASQEVEALQLAANSGVSLITSIHARDFEELSRKPLYAALMETKAFSWIAELAGAEHPAQIKEIREAKR